MREGERQVAPTLAGIRRDHVARYQWAARQLSKGCRVADLACGIGYGSRVLAEAGFRVVGLDKDREAIDYARAHYAHAKTRFIATDGGVPRGLGASDAAVCFETIEHVEDPRPLLRFLRTKAGTLLASVPNEDVFPWKGYAFHFRHYTKTQFRELLAETGWEVIEWWGQLGPESEVERNCMGRTIIAVAKRSKPKKAARRAAPAPAANPKVPGHVVILGMGPSITQYLEIVKRMGGRSAFCDEVWTINALGDVFDCDRVFHMDDVRIQEIRAEAAPASNIAALLPWLRRHPGPVYTSRPHPDYPGLVSYPLEAVINSTGFGYMNSTAAYAVAYAVHLGVKKITVFGNDFTYPNAHHAERGRACVEFWLGMAAARGIQIAVPQTSSLMDACAPAEERLYGYDTLEVSITGTRGNAKVEFTERKVLPSAAEIEHRYDHGRHPSPLVDS